ncbi:hypothetical protein NPIL_469901 [Nephila pilipes]|uniref:Uncharacterized protein n=1 Tax=Nephila pilipes TaxID=299642 RepID=A0A8X6NGT5_NEPPI|nr:hypothetical protein NPIL_469901 [Nephila pilipes]
MELSLDYKQKPSPEEDEQIQRRLRPQEVPARLQTPFRDVTAHSSPEDPLVEPSNRRGSGSGRSRILRQSSSDTPRSSKVVARNKKNT